MRALLLALVLFALAAAHADADDATAVQPADRDVSPPGVMPIPSGPLTRVPTPPRPPEPARWQRYFLPATPDAATFVVPGLTVHIAGVSALKPGETCQGADGAWPCGATALYAFRRFLRGRAVECYFPYREGIGEVTAPCRIGRQDVGLWLLQSGWARPSDLASDGYRSAAMAAECAAIGIWQGRSAPAGCAANAPKS